MSRMFGRGGADNYKKSFKKKEMEHELGKSEPVRKKMTGIVYHDSGTKIDKRGKKYSPHFGSKEDGHVRAKIHGGTYSHFTEEEQTVLENSPCWKKYKMVGKKIKNGKEVPNCVPENVEENILDIAKKVSPTASSKSTADKKKERDELLASRAKNSKPVQKVTGVSKTDAGYGQNRYMGDSVEENHLPVGTELKCGKDKMKVQKQVGDSKYVVKVNEEALDFDFIFEDNYFVLTLSEQYGPYTEEAAKRVAARKSLTENTKIISFDEVMLHEAAKKDSAEDSLEEFKAHKAKAVMHMNKAKKLAGTDSSEYYMQLHYAHDSAHKAAKSVGHHERMHAHGELANKFLGKSIDKMMQ